MSRKNSFDDVATAFRHGNFKPLYLLYGEESYLADKLQALALKHALQPHEKDFNLDVVYGPDSDARQVLGLCAGYPVMAERRLVIVRDFGKLEDSHLFKSYAEQPNPTAVVILIVNGKANMTRHPYRALRQHGVAIELKHPSDRELPRLIEREVKAKGRTIDPRASQMLAEYVGGDLQTLMGELDKVLTFAGDRQEVGPDDVVQASGHSREENVFELQKAVGQKRQSDAIRIAERLLQQSSNSQGQALMIIALLTTYFTKLWILTSCQKTSLGENEMAKRIGVPPFYLSEYLNTLRRFDAPSLASAFRALASADFELKGGSGRDARLTLMLAIQQITIEPSNASIAA